MSTKKKYEFTGETMIFEGRTLRRIRYLREKPYTKKGSLGGWLEHEGNLSHEGDCAIKYEAKVFGNACVMQNAVIFHDAIVKDNAIVKGESYITNNSIIGGDTIISDETHISGDSKIFFYAQIFDKKHGKESLHLNISGDSELVDCVIEATGEIVDSELENKNLSGFLNLKNIISLSEESPLYEKV